MHCFFHRNFYSIFDGTSVNTLSLIPNIEDVGLEI